MSKQAETVLDKLANLQNVKVVEFDEKGNIERIEFHPPHTPVQTIIREKVYEPRPWWSPWAGVTWIGANESATYPAAPQYMLTTSDDSRGGWRE